MDTKKDKFLPVIENHKGLIFKIAHAYCHDHEDRKDLIQEIIIQLWLSFDRYDNRFTYSTWIYRIALNTAISFYRNNRIHREKTVELSEVIAASGYVAEPFDHDARVNLLHRFIHELKAMDKALILLYLDGLSQKEISKIMGITATNVSTRIGRIKHLLKEKFDTIKNNNHERH